MNSNDILTLYLQNKLPEPPVQLEEYQKRSQDRNRQSVLKGMLGANSQKVISNMNEFLNDVNEVNRER